MQEFSKSPLTVADYEQMAHAGLLSADRRYELLEGDIYEMSPIGSVHAACVDFLVGKLAEVADRDFIIRAQGPIQLSDISEPQPDVSLLRKRDDHYRNAHPTPEQVLCVIEVSDSTLLADRRYKMPLYAKAGIPEAWVIDLAGEQVEVNADPVDGQYRLTQVFRRGETVHGQTLPAISIAVDEIFG
jgi:Uma2 family endonuclease